MVIWVRCGLTLALLAASGTLTTRAHGSEPAPVRLIQVPAEFGAAAPADEALYRAACASCHGVDGRGAPASAIAFDVPLPDFTDCSFASREPDADWFAVVHEGGPVRGFHRLMPAFGDALTDQEIQRILDYVRTLCGERDWPRGELNLPRALATEKAYPEDEAVVTMATSLDDDAAWSAVAIYERRFGARNQIEFVVPFGMRERAPGRWVGGVGDLAIALKRAVFHSHDRGSILSVAGEVILPTGDEADGFGSGHTTLEPFLAFGQILPADGFLQVQTGLEVPVGADGASNEAFWRAVLGRSVTSGGPFGRTWSPMIEILGARELAGGEHVRWDVLPQVQVTLNTRQHLMANVGVRVPVSERSGRSTELLVYLLWDWFDGGLRDGW